MTQQVVARQPVIRYSISLLHPFNRAGGRTSNVLIVRETWEEMLEKVYAY